MAKADVILSVCAIGVVVAAVCVISPPWRASIPVFVPTSTAVVLYAVTVGTDPADIAFHPKAIFPTQAKCYDAVADLMASEIAKGRTVWFECQSKSEPQTNS